MTTLALLLRDAVARSPDRVALEVDGIDQLTYRAWEQRSDAAAVGLQRRGVAAGDLVGLASDTRGWCDHAVAHLAVHKVGAVALHLPPGAGAVATARVVRAHRPRLVVAPPQSPGPGVALHALEADGAGRAPTDVVPADDAEILTGARPLAPAVGATRTLDDVLASPAWLGGGREAGVMLHTFAPGTAAGQDALVLALGPRPIPSIVVPAADTDRICSLLSRGAASWCVLHPATALALLAAGAATGRDLGGVQRVVLLGGRTTEALRTGVQRMFAAATVASAAVPEQGVPVAPADAAPVAFSQEGMIWHEHFTPGCQNLPGLARRYRGPLDVEALDAALDEIVRRHEPLRTTFALREGRLLQVVRPHTRMVLPVHDLTGLPAEVRDEEVAGRVADAGRRPFDLNSDPVFAATLLRLDDDDHVLVIRTHHSVFDDWSVGVFRRELAALYTAFSAGQPSPLPDPPRFTEFARKQRRRLSGSAGESELAFWRRELHGAPLTTQLPVDDPAAPPGTPQPAGEPVSLTLPRSLHEGLRALARAQRATVFMTMLAAYAVLLHRYTGQDDLLLATVVANRNRTDHEGMVGCFTKKVPLRLRLDGDPSFSDTLTRTRSALLGALTHQDLPFEVVVQETLGAPAAAHGLVPHVVAMFQGEAPRRELVLPGLETSGFQTATTTRRAHFMADDTPPAHDAPPWGAGLYLGTFVILSVAESDDGLRCIARGAFHGPSVRRLLDAYQAVLAEVVADPARRVADLRLLAPAGEAEALALGRGPGQPADATSVHAAFDARAGTCPDAVAIRAGDDTVTYAQLARRSTRLARRLAAMGVGRGATVGLADGAAADAVVGALAIWRAGAAWVGVGAEGTGDDRAAILRAASARLVVGGAGDTLTDPPGVVDAGDEAADATTTSPEVPAGPDDCAVVVTTTAGSGMVALDHRGVLAMAARVRDLRDGPSAAVRKMCVSAAVTDGGFVRALAALLDGHTLCVPARPPVTDPAPTIELVASGAVDTLDCAPEELTALLDAGLQDALGRRPPDSAGATVVIGASGAVDSRTWTRARRLAGARVTVVLSAPQCAFAATGAAVADSARPVVGRPLPGVEAHVLDARGRPVPAGARGELHLDGAATSQRARRLPDGTVELLGSMRVDDDLRGFTVDTERVRSALAGFPGIRDVAVSIDRHGSEGPRLVARVTADGPPPTVGALRAHLWATLPGYACPSQVVEEAAAGPASPTTPAGDDGSAEATVLGELWAEALDSGHVPAGANYWQRFSFLEVLVRAAETGLHVTGEQVTRHRTIGTLATDLAVQRRGGQ